MQYPYIPNSNEAVRKEMLDFIGAKSVEDIYSFIPDEVRMKKPLDIPAPFTTEQELSKHMNSTSSARAAMTTMFPPSATRSTAAASSSPLTAAIPTPTTASARRSSSSPA